MFVGILRPRRLLGAVLVGAAISLAAAPTVASADNVPLVTTALTSGRLADGDAALAAAVARDPADANARFGLGIVRFMRAVEHLGQSLHRYGLRSPRTMDVPILRLPVPENPHPEVLTYAAFRAMLQTFDDELASADATLETVGATPVELRLDLGAIRLDMAGDGSARGEEPLWTVLSGMSPGRSSGSDAAPNGTVAVLDNGDAAWLRGYSHLLMAFTDFLLAYDFQPMFDGSFSLFFPRVAGHEGFGRDEDRSSGGFTGVDIEIADLVSLVHLIHWPVAEPDRLERSRAHLLRVVVLSRESWTDILARTSRAVRWMPAPDEGTVVPGLAVTRERIDAWQAVLADAEAALEGRKLVPHWRFTKGIDLKRVFSEPRPLDLVLWITGVNARPYLASGDVISTASWGQMERAFEGNFLTYAFWFN